MSENRPFELERLKYWQGQKLCSRDFRDQTSFEAQLRWWHNRALHNAYGVSYGFTVSLSSGRIKIDCGVAYDCYGRELILQVPREIAFPPTPTEKFESMTLLASFSAADRSISNEEILMGTVDCSSRRIEPWIEWKPSRAVELTDGVPISEIIYETFAPLEALPENVRIPVSLRQKVFYDPERKVLVVINGLTPDDVAELKQLPNQPEFVSAVDKLAADEPSPMLNARFITPRARGLTRPRIGTGATVAGDTAWELWTESIVNPRGVRVEADLGIQVTIDTSGAGFTEVPCYFAWLEGTLWNQVHLNFFPVPITHIDRESMRRFRLRLWMPPIVTVLGARVRFANVDPFSTVREREPRGFATDFVNFARQQKLYVCWLGIQEAARPECQPLANCHCDTAPKVAEQKDVATTAGRRLNQAARRSSRR